MTPAKEPEMKKLRRGKHGLTRGEVSAQQRERILRGMIYEVAERGYPETTVKHVIERAGVSRKTYYQLFDDKEDCFLVAYDVVQGMLLGATTAAFEAEPDLPWADRVANALEALLTTVSDHPEAARFAIVEVMAAGPKALARRDAAMRRFMEFIDARSESRSELPPITALALVGGIYEFLYTEITQGERDLVRYLPDLVHWVTLPYLGEKRADKERERARKRLASGSRRVTVASETAAR
jgi:AcrR family transcriptional regulator